MKQLTSFFAILQIVAGLSCAIALAQETRGKIAGRVLDPTGAVIPGVPVKATNAQTNVAAAGVTNASGNFEILYLAPGSYNLSAELAGFKKYLHAGIQLRVDDELSFDIKLEPGDVSESITVSGATPMLETGTSLGQVADNQRITELPLSGDNAYSMASLTAGVVFFDAPNHPQLAPAVEVVSNIGVSGVRAYNTEFALDGAPSMWGRYAAFVPPSDMIAEFKVETSHFDATSRSPGGAVNVALRSGTNKLHGTLSENWSNTKLESLDLFQRRELYNTATGPPTQAKLSTIQAPFIFNHFGATLGGPVDIPKIYDGRNRTFWMYGFDGLTRPAAGLGTNYLTVPTIPERQGDFSALLAQGGQYQIYDPATITPAANGRYSRQPLPGNVIPKSRLAPVAQGLLQYWPAPNSPGLANGENNFYTSLPTYNQYFSHTVRVDHNLNENHRLFVRYDQSHQLFDTAENLPTIASGYHRNRYNHGFGVDDVYVIGPEFLVNFRYSLTRFVQTSTPFSQGFDLAAAGFSPQLLSQISPPGDVFPRISVTGYQVLGDSQPSGTFTNYHTWGADFTRIHGSHSIRFGAEFRLYRAYNRNLSYQTPEMDFGTGWTVGPVDNSAAAPIGQGLASFLFGLPTGGQAQVNASYAEQTTFTAGFVQDEYKVSPRLTLNFGLRYEYETAPTERYNRSVQGFDFNAVNPIQAQALANYALAPDPAVPMSAFTAHGGLTFAGVNGNPRTLWQTEKNNFAPRAGLALLLPHSTVFRMGYGLFYITNGVDRLDVNQAGFTQTTTLTPSLDNGQTFVATMANPFPNGYLQPVGAAAGLASNLGNAITFFNSTRPHGYAQRWSAGIQKQLPRNTLFEVSYVGTASSRLDITRQWDPPPRQYLSTSPVRDPTAINFLTAAVTNPFYPMLAGSSIAGKTIARSQLLRPYPEFSGITSVTQAGYSWYQSLQVRVDRRLRGGFTIQGNYTWAKFIEGTSYLNPTDTRPEYAVSDEDRPQRVAASGIYDLPFGAGRKFGSEWNRAPRSLVSGWQFAAIYSAQSGSPLAFGDVLIYGTLHDIVLPIGQRSVSEWFNTGIFEKASGKQLANNIRTFPSALTGARGPGINTWNLSLLRTFRIMESARLQFRAEWLDATGHTFLANPNVTPTAAAFGTITGTNGYPRQLYFAAKLIF